MNHAYKLLDELLKRHLVLSCLFNFSGGLAIKKVLFKRDFFGFFSFYYAKLIFNLLKLPP